MFKKNEESEWTRFSRALGGSPQAPSSEDVQTSDDEPAEAVTLAQPTPAPPEAHLPPPPRETEPLEPPAPAYPPVGPTGATSTPSTSIGRISDVSDDETVVGDGASIEGTVRSDRAIRVRGAVQGEIECKQRVVVEETARVAAKISAEHVTVLGEVNGSIECQGRLEIASSARVTGEVSATTLVIQEGAFFEGNLRMTSTREESQPTSLTREDSQP
jgi:cytoskeletal protein CcmA (bactofilin family)